MMRDRDVFAVLFLPRSVGHRFRELGDVFASQCRSRDLHSRIALDTRRWRSPARCTLSMRPCSSACRTL